ncbi:MAG TPA: hypothetical protein VHM27_15080 [Rhizomicrobium sp.]|jgi:hypothetical protein|nr:hypothetical protein [Rhizomicrobium sp.]
MKTSLVLVSAVVTLLAGAAWAQPWRGGDAIPMRDGSTIITMGGDCLVQYGRRNERINNAQRCSENDLREADRRMAGGGRPGFDGRPGDGRPGYGGGDRGMPYGSWSESCRGGSMRGQLFQAECRNSDGRWNTTVLDMRNCPSGNAENRNGSLVCR